MSQWYATTDQTRSIFKHWPKGSQPHWLAGRGISSQLALIYLFVITLCLGIARMWSMLGDDALNESLHTIRGMERYTDGATWTRMSSLAPVGMQEGSGVRVKYTKYSERLPRDEIWFAGGYPTDEGRVLIFDVETHEWRLPPEQRLHWPLHHCLHSIFYDEKNCRVVLLGGIKIVNGQHAPNHAALTFNLCDSGVPQWTEKPLQVGGIISCSTITLQGKYWCYSGSNEYVEEEFKFFSFDLESLTVEFFPSPKYESTHVSILIDEEQNIVYLSGGRDRETNAIGKLVSFDLRSKSWTSEEIDIPFIPVDDRGYIQLPGRRALLFGGQATGTRNVVTDIILEFDFRTKEISVVGESPLPLFGEEIVDMKNGSYFVFSGSSGVGPKYSRSSWMYNPQKLRTKISSTPGQPTIVDATCGSTPVTLALQIHVREILEKHSSPVYIPARWCTSGLGPGNHAVLNVLTITFQRDGTLHRVQCEDINSCLLSP